MRFMQTSKLFTLLPEELVCTPDGMAIDRDGNLILSCPNFADLSMPSCVLKIDKDRNIKKWFDVPRNEYTGEARAMGIEFGPDGDLYLVDNAGWTGEPHMVFTGRILRLRLNDAGVVKCTVVADNMEHPNGIRIWGDYMYVTQSCMTRQKTDSGKLMSCVYRFPLDAEGIHCTNTLADPLYHREPQVPVRRGRHRVRPRRQPLRRQLRRRGGAQNHLQPRRLGEGEPQVGL